MNFTLRKKFLIIVVGILLVAGAFFWFRGSGGQDFEKYLKGYKIENEAVKNSPELQQDYKQRFEAAKASLLANPDQMDDWLTVASVKTAVGDYKGAEEVYLHLNEIRPENSTSFANLGVLYMQYLPNYVKSEEMFRKALENQPNDVLTWRNFYELYKYHYADKNQAATPTLEDALRVVPTDPSLWALLAQEYTDTGNKSAAIRAWQEYLKLRPGDQQATQAIRDLQS